VRRVTRGLGWRTPIARRRLPLRRVPLAVVLLAGFACADTPAAGDFRVGATRAEVLEDFGPPSGEQSLRKTGDAIWGPIESFWSEVPPGSTVEVWSYPVEGGSVELYFVDGSERVRGMGFAPEGAVFEAGRPPGADRQGAPR
jgi:hypothetical protein